MSEEKYSIEEIEKFLTYFDGGFKGDSVEILLSDLTPENIRKANEPPVNKNQIKLDIQ